MCLSELYSTFCSSLPISIFISSAKKILIHCYVPHHYMIPRRQTNNLKTNLKKTLLIILISKEQNVRPMMSWNILKKYSYILSPLAHKWMEKHVKVIVSIGKFICMILITQVLVGNAMDSSG